MEKIRKGPKIVSSLKNKKTMNEILEIRDDKQITDKKEISHLDVFLEYRNEFQWEVLSLLIAEKILVKNDTKKTLEYAETISKFIDNSDNVEVRELIRQGKFKEAAQLMVDEIHREEFLPNAA